MFLKYLRVDIRIAEDIDSHFMQMVYCVARSYSDDPDTQVGCVLISSDESIYTGTNRFKDESYRQDPKWLEKPYKYEAIMHAEEDVIQRAEDEGSICKTAYINLMPCTGCAQKLIDHGVTQLVVDYNFMQEYYRTGAGMKRHKDFMETMKLFKKNNVKVYAIEYEAN